MCLQMRSYLGSLITDVDTKNLSQVIFEFSKTEFIIPTGVKFKKTFLVLFPGKRHD